MDLFDYVILSVAWGSREGDLKWNPAADMDCDGDIDASDYLLLMMSWGAAPGPSGLFCAGVPAQQPCRDADGDEVRDYEDNCTQVFNPTQCDVDVDGFGNHCDADLDHDGEVDMADFFPFLSAWGSQEGDSNWNPEADLDCDGDVDGQLSDLPDVGTDGALLGVGLSVGSPGPSGLACAGAPPCP